MKILPFLFYPFIGALIGWVTNTVAIWMLFHPFEEKRIWGKKIPFTPGLIPARIERLAREVSVAIRDHFLSGTDVKDILKELALGEVLTAEDGGESSPRGCDSTMHARRRGVRDNGYTTSLVV